MKTYHVVGPLARIEPGRELTLDAAQAKARRLNIELVKAGDDGGVYRSIRALQFKRGEQFGLDGDLDRLQAEALMEVGEKSGHTVGEAQRADRGRKAPDKKTTESRKDDAAAAKTRKAKAAAARKAKAAAASKDQVSADKSEAANSDAPADAASQLV